MSAAIDNARRDGAARARLINDNRLLTPPPSKIFGDNSHGDFNRRSDCSLVCTIMKASRLAAMAWCR
jgi:hypothetical protein